MCLQIIALLYNLQFTLDFNMYVAFTLSNIITNYIYINCALSSHVFFLFSKKNTLWLEQT